MTSVFIELAEYLGISDKIDTFVLDEACRASVDFMKIFGSDFTVSVNVTAHELQSKAIIKKFWLCWKSIIYLLKILYWRFLKLLRQILSLILMLV